MIRTTSARSPRSTRPCQHLFLRPSHRVLDPPTRLRPLLRDSRPLASALSYSTTSAIWSHFSITIARTDPSSRETVKPLRSEKVSRTGSQTGRIQQSGFGSLTSALIVAVVGSVVVAYASYEVHSPGSEQSVREEDTSKVREAAHWAAMTGETLPGRPGTLTAEEEEKLREFWVATFKVFGIVDENAGEASQAFQAQSANAEKPKKKSFFSRKAKDVDSSSEDDKYGQTKQFHEVVASQKPEALRATAWAMMKHDHPDALLLRFLRARKWDVEKALYMMISTMNWRGKEMHVDDDIMLKGEEGHSIASQSGDYATKTLGEDFLTQMRTGKSFLHGVDKEGRPICFVRARLHKGGEQCEESLEKLTVYTIETARLLLEPPVDTACIVFDLTGFSLANMDYAPVKFMIKCFEANYPESLGVVLVHKAPWVFQGVWKIIKGWLDPVVANKVHFTNNVEEMEQYVPRSNIIKELEGDEDWTWEYHEPVPGENDKMKDTATRDKLLAERKKIAADFEKATLKWIHKGLTPELKQERYQLANDLKENYWKLDPYIRARSVYDRTGVIRLGGKVENHQTVAAPPLATNGTETKADDVD